MLVASTCFTFLIFTCSVWAQTETTLLDLVKPTLPPGTSPINVIEPVTDTPSAHNIQQQTTTEQVNELTRRWKVIKDVLELILPLEDAELDVLKDFLPVTVELSKLTLHFVDHRHS